MNKFKTIVLAAVLVGLGAGCSNQAADEQAERALKGNGLKNIHIEGYRYFGCGKDDLYHVGFSALTQDDEPVSGVVCSAPFKGATVRFD